MARVIIALGARDHKPESELSVVYAGRDGSAMERALAASPFPAHLVIKNPPYIRKQNGAAAANLAKIVQAERSMEQPEYKVTKAEMDGYLAEMKRLQDLVNSRAVELTAAQARIAELEKAALPVVAEVAPETPVAPTAPVEEAKPVPRRR